MSFVTLDDVNVFLPVDKLEALDADNDSAVLDSERIIKAKLSGTFSATTIASWVSPATTPETIRAICGRLVAALYYAKAFSAETPDVPTYAQNLYNDAMNMLECIKTGDIILPEVPTVDQPTTGGTFGAADFLPNASSPGPFFTMSEVWG